MSQQLNPIGVFDSGVGGLTVLRALRAALPGEDLVYLGDTARLPYGTKSAGTVAQYAQQAAGYLLRQPLKALVIACNTATAHALPVLQQSYPDIPVIGVIEPGAQLAAAHNRVLVLATEGTIRSQAYSAAIKARNPACEVISIPATLLVALAEEGWTDGVEAQSIIQRYLQPVAADLPPALVLGCTHFPLLIPALRAAVGPHVQIIDSAHTTAQTVTAQLSAAGLLRAGHVGTTRLLATDGAARFARVASLFLGHPVEEQAVEIVDLLHPSYAAVEPA